MGEQEVPSVLRRLWGRTGRDRPRRGPKPALSVDRIVRAAAGLADSEGLAAVSMARVAETLGCSAMALYRHVESKDELLVLLTDHIADGLEMPEHAAGWRSGLEAWTRAQIELALARPWMLDLPLSVVPPGPQRLRWMEIAFAAMRDVDLPGDEKLAVIGLLAQHVLAEARVQVETRRAAAAAVRRSRALPPGTPESEPDAGGLTGANPMSDFEAVLRDLADPADYPNLTAAMEQTSGPTPWNPDTEIDLGLQIVLDGVEAYVGARTGRTTVGPPREDDARDEHTGDPPAGRHRSA